MQHETIVLFFEIQEIVLKWIAGEMTAEEAMVKIASLVSATKEKP